MALLHRPLVLLGIDRDSFATIGSGARNIQTRIAGDPVLFPAAVPRMPDLLQRCLAYDDAQDAVVHTRAVGTTAIRWQKREELWSSLLFERTYVQSLCDAAIGDAGVITVTAGMVLKRPRTDHREILVARQTTVPGEVELTAAASLLQGPAGRPRGQRTYLWRHTLDGGLTFLDDEPTPIATTRIRGLPRLVTLGFEVAVKDAVGPGAWSQTVKILLT
jgi:hypothetical protein